jgi:hypothetical protein
VNQTLPSLHEGALGITLTVPLKSSFQELNIDRKKYAGKSFKPA